jgi:hypothetical protein
MILKTNFLQVYILRTKKYLHYKQTGGGGEYPAPVFGGEKMLQNSMVAGIEDQLV